MESVFKSTAWLTKGPAFSVSESFFFKRGLAVSGLRLVSFHKVSPRTHQAICNNWDLLDILFQAFLLCSGHQRHHIISSAHN